MPENEEPEVDSQDPQTREHGETAATRRQPIVEPASVTEAENESAREDRMHGQKEQPGLPESNDEEWSPGSSAADK
ncbi:MAG: hypothetical protein WKF92_07530 [Pyrinomonadaceae bacterium]